MVQVTNEIIFSGCGELWARVFDHRPFINGELKFMVREFEEKRADREISNLFSIIENSTEINDNQVNQVIQLTDANVPTLIEKLNQACDETSAIFAVEKEKSQEKPLKKRREERKKVWNTFIEDMSQKYTRIDNAFEQKEEELSDLFADLEHKLNITTKLN